jgi:zinc transport system substrate-binding protein
MKRNLKAFASIIIAIALLLAIVTGCDNNKNKDFEDDKIRVAVSILPQAEFVEKIGGDKVIVTVIIPPGASPHTYEPSPAQLEEISRAGVYAKVGSGIEFEREWMDKIIKLNRKMLVVDCKEGVKFIASGEADDESVVYEQPDRTDETGGGPRGADPHIWLSIKNAKIMSENIYSGLIAVDPENMQYYRENLDDFIEELDKLDSEIRQVFEGKKNKVIIVYHPNWTYFASDYDIRQISIEEDGKEPAAGHMKELIDEALEYNIKTIFASPEFSTRSAEVLAGEIGGSVVLISPLEKNYMENMKKAAEAFAKTME